MPIRLITAPDGRIWGVDTDLTPPNKLRQRPLVVYKFTHESQEVFGTTEAPDRQVILAMSEDTLNGELADAQRSRVVCSHCELINYWSDRDCTRCGRSLRYAKKRHLLLIAGLVFALVASCVFAWYRFQAQTGN